MNVMLVRQKCKKKLFEGVLELLQPYGVDMVSLFKKEMAVVSYENGAISGRIRCVLCDTKFETEKKKKKRRQELYSQYWKGQSWCLSNFSNHHLRKVHPIQNYADQEGKGDDFQEEKSAVKPSQSKKDTPADGLKNDSNEENAIEKSMWIKKITQLRKYKFFFSL